jgi:dTDP-4-dehydrorhamnose reductase
VQVLVVGADSAAGMELQAALARWGRHRLTLLGVSAARWKSERQAKKAVRRSRPDIVVDLRVPHMLAAREAIQPLDLERGHWLAKASQRAGIAYLYLSSARVFSGRLPHPYRVQEAPDAEQSPGSLLLEAEARVRDGCDRHLILRVGPVFASTGDNLLTRLLAPLAAGESLALDDHDQFCPVDAGDLARVVSAVLDQLDAGAEAWGTYHYASSDRTTRYGFAEALLAAASQFAACEGASIERAPEPEERAPRNWSLDCRELRDTFAIKQMPWRGVVSAAVRDYFLQTSGE